MAQFSLTIDCDNAAFTEDYPGDEIARILRELAEKIEGGTLQNIRLNDINGNFVGIADLSE
jgi:hypothetical protein